MIELKLVTVYYISINYHTEALEMMKGTGVCGRLQRQLMSPATNSKRVRKNEQKRQSNTAFNISTDAVPAHVCSSGLDGSLSCIHH